MAKKTSKIKKMTLDQVMDLLVDLGSPDVRAAYDQHGQIVIQTGMRETGRRGTLIPAPGFPKP